MDPSLYNAAMEGDFLLADQLISDEEIGYQVTPKGNTIVHVAALWGRFHFVGEVLKITPTLLCRQNKKNETALHIAANEGHTEVVRVLFSIAGEEYYKEALMRMTDASGDTALHKAVRSQHLDVVKLLVKEDPEFEFPANNTQETPLYLAAESGVIDILREILESCKNPNYAAGPLRRTPLHAAVVLEYSDCTRLLWQQNKSLCEEPDEWGWNSLHYAVKLELKEVVSDMLGWKKSLAYLSAGCENDWTTTFHIAASEGNRNMLVELLKHCPDCWEMLNSRGQNALHVAALNNQASSLLYSLKSKNWGSLVDEPDNDGNTPLHMLADSLNYIPEELRSHPKAKKMSLNKDNQTPRDIIVRKATSKEEAIKCKYYMNRFNCGRCGRRRFKIMKSQEQLEEREMWNKDDYYKSEMKAIKERGQIHLVVAILLMTITFAAGFTLPGGFESDPNSSNKGMAILMHKTAFRAFVVSDAIAFAFSAAAVLNYFFMATVTGLPKSSEVAMWKLDRIGGTLQFWAMLAVVIAFISGVYATLAHSLGLAITVCAIVCVSFLLYMVHFVRLGIAFRKAHKNEAENSFYPSP